MALLVRLLAGAAGVATGAFVTLEAAVISHGGTALAAVLPAAY